jgi:hypothetical protein
MQVMRDKIANIRKASEALNDNPGVVDRGNGPSSQWQSHNHRDELFIVASDWGLRNMPLLRLFRN